MTRGRLQPVNVKRMETIMRNGLPAVLLALFVVSGCVSQHHEPGAEEVRLQLGMHYLAGGDYAAAERNFLRAQAAAPEDYRGRISAALPSSPTEIAFFAAVASLINASASSSVVAL